MVILSTAMRSVGLLRSRPLDTTGVSPILSSTSSPLMTWPKAVYFPSRNGAASRQIKNWEPAESGSLLRAMERTPRSCLRSLNSALIL